MERVEEELVRVRAELERCQAELAARGDCERELEALINAAVDGVIVADARGRIERFSQAAARIFGRDPAAMIGRPIELLMSSPDREQHAAYIARHLESGERRVIGVGREVTGVRSDGETFPAELGISRIELDGAVKFVALIRDIGERRRREERFRERVKLEALQRLARGLAHDFNNLLMAVGGHADIVTNSLGPRSEARVDARRIKDAALRGSMITRTLLAFGGVGVIDPTTFAINDVVAGCEATLRQFLRPGQHLEITWARTEPQVRCERGLFEQIIVNLVTNARDAISDRGRLEVALDEQELAAEEAERVGLAPGQYVTLVVRDDGRGMDAATRARVFEPFFTTKPTGTGRGLGLPLIQGVVSQCGGAVELDSAPGAGTTVRVLLPRIDESADERASARDSGGKVEVALVVEDDPLVRRAIHFYLDRWGVRVLEASSLSEARAHLGREPSIDMLLADVVLPDGDSPLWARELTARLADVRVVFMSAHPLELLTEEGRVNARTPFLQKPFDEDAIVSLLHAQP
ncbi:MAG: PAS domain S-box protein [Nannocystaceae bacterium]